MEESLARVQLAAADREWLQFQLDNADMDLHDAIREALRAGIPAELLMCPAGLTLGQITAIAARAD